MNYIDSLLVKMSLLVVYRILCVWRDVGVVGIVKVHFRFCFEAFLHFLVVGAVNRLEGLSPPALIFLFIRHFPHFQSLLGKFLLYLKLELDLCKLVPKITLK